MRNVRNVVIFHLFFLYLAFFTFIPDVFCQVPPTLQEGIEQYRQENYEEAIEILTKVWGEQEPQSPVAAFFLGMAYKQVMDYPQASVHLEAAVTLTPRVKEALLELADVMYQLGKLEEAKK